MEFVMKNYNTHYFVQKIAPVREYILKYMKYIVKIYCFYRYNQQL